MKTETFDLTFSFDDLNVLGVVGNNIHLSVSDEGNNDCVLSLTREQFVKAMNNWLDRKAQFWDNWGHYCGVGYILVYDCIRIGLAQNEVDELYSTQENSEIIPDIEHG